MSAGKILGRNVRRALADKAWKQSDLYQCTDLSAATIQRICAGKSNLRLATLQKIAKALNIELAELVKD